MQTQDFDLHILFGVLDCVTFPEDDSENHSLYALELGLSQLKTDLSKYKSFPCVVCNNTGHSFQDCPALQNTPRVQEAYGKLRAYLNRCCNVANKLNKSLVELSDTPIHQLQLHSLPCSHRQSTLSVDADVSALTTPTAVKSLGVDAATEFTAPLEDDASYDGSLDF